MSPSLIASRRIAPWIALVVLVLLLALTPFLPRGGGYHEPTARRAGEAVATPSAQTVGYGRLTPAARRTIDRIAAESTAIPGRSADPRALVDAAVRCATFEGQRYCLDTGWTRRTQAEVRAATARALTRQAAHPGSGTGDRSALATVRRTAALAPAARADAVRRELTEAARSVAKVWLLRHEIQRIPLPAHFFAQHPEVATTAASTTPATTTTTLTAPATVIGKSHKPWSAYPDRGTVLGYRHVSEQHRTYWCGPTTMQMIAWGWTGQRKSQQHWARRLGTTTSGSSITEMVRVVNTATGYDRADRAGPYIVLDISDWTFHQWILLMARHVVDYRAPVVLHPVLLARYFPYLDHDGSGHFQVGRGYQKRDGKTPLLGYFEPWDQQRFHPDEPYIDRVQWRSAYQSYRANQAHFQHDLGV